MLKKQILKNIIFFPVVFLLFSCSQSNTTQQQNRNAKIDSTAVVEDSAKLEAHPDTMVSKIPETVAMQIESKNMQKYLSPNSKKPAVKDKMKFHIIEVYYGTDRIRLSYSSDHASYGDIRRVEKGYDVGVARISVPIDEEGRVIQNPHNWKYWFRADAYKKIMTLTIIPLNYAAFVTRVRRAVDSSDDKDEFVFVHGYNNSFEDALKKTAQITYDIKFKGAPMMFSWPSRHKTLGYCDDEDAVKWATGHLKDFITNIVLKTNAKKIHLIAHSMGNRALTDVIASLQAEHKDVLFDQIILAAADVDSATFQRVFQIN